MYTDSLYDVGTSCPVVQQKEALNAHKTLEHVTLICPLNWNNAPV